MYLGAKRRYINTLPFVFLFKTVHIELFLIVGTELPGRVCVMASADAVCWALGRASGL